MLERGGVLGRGNEDWRNVSEHCLTEAVVGSLLAEALSADMSAVERALLLHDIVRQYKRFFAERAPM